MSKEIKIINKTFNKTTAYFQALAFISKEKMRGLGL